MAGSEWYTSAHHAMQEGALQKRRRLLADEDREVTSRDLSTYGRPLDMVTSFKYLERVISAANDEYPSVVGNLAKAWVVWHRLARILSREEAAMRVSGLLFKYVVQSVMLFGAETWVFTPRMGWVLAGFQEHVA